MHLCMELCGGGELFDSIVEAGNFSEKKAAAVRRVWGCEGHLGLGQGEATATDSERRWLLHHHS